MIKQALIFGATGGIGSALAKQLQQQDPNWRFFLSNRSGGSALDSLAQELRAECVAGDVADSSFVEKVFRDFKFEKDGHLSVALCVGSILLKPAHLTSNEEWMETLQKNLFSAFYVLREAVKQRRTKSLSMLFFSSAASEVGLKNHEAIAAAKSGLVGLVRSAAASYARHQYRFNVIAPGLVETSLSQKILSAEASRKASEAMHPLGRVGLPSDVTSLACVLMEPEQSAWITGQVFGVDGGLSNLRV